MTRSCPRVSSRYYLQESGAFENFGTAATPTRSPSFRPAEGCIRPPRNAKFLTMWMDRGRVGDTRLLSENLMIEALQIHPLTLDALVPYGMLGEIALARGAANPAADASFPSFGHRGIDGTNGMGGPRARTRRVVLHTIPVRHDTRRHRRGGARCH